MKALLYRYRLNRYRKDPPMVITALALFDITAADRSLARSALPGAPGIPVRSKRAR
jgi:hypothetical protein